MDQKGPSYSKHDKHEGFLMPYGFPLENFSAALEYAAQKNDLFIATYPKCGTTLCQHMIYLLLNGGDPIKPDEKLDRMFPHIEEVGKDFIEKSAVIRYDRRLIKTHLPYSMTPMSKEAKYIFIARNPKVRKNSTFILISWYSLQLANIFLRIGLCCIFLPSYTRISATLQF